MKSVLITGASSGIGLSLAKLYAKHHYHVIACGRNQKNLQTLTDDLKSKGGSAEYLCFDITDKNAIGIAAEKIEQPIDILLLNAGDCEYIKNSIPFDGELFARVINVNLVALGHVLASFLAKVPQGGQVVFVSSIVTLMPFPEAHAYGASKAGVDYLANTLRFDLADNNIGVTLIHPGFVKTPLTDKNNFSMPFILSSEQAALRIFSGVEKRKSYLSFPRRFSLLLTLFSFLPDCIWQKLVFKGSNS